MSLARLLRNAQALGLVDDSIEENESWAAVVSRVRDRIRSELFDEQLRLLEEVRTWAAASCGRQAGKNFTVARLLIDVALARPDRNCVYVNETYGEARRIMWGDPLDGLPSVLRSLGLVERAPGAIDWHYQLNETRLEVTFRNGSKVELLGADRGAWEKLRGNKFDLVVVDECQKLDDSGFLNAIEKVLPDTFVSRRGRFVGIGTPDEFCVGVFHDICTGAIDPATGRPRFPHFTHHHWDASQNTFRPDIWEEKLRHKAERLLDDDDPTWLREGKGLWVRSDQSLILALSERALWSGVLPSTVQSMDGTPVPRSEAPRAYAGLDFGHTAPNGLVVGSVSREEGVLREVHSEKRAGLNTRELAEWLAACRDRFGIEAFYGDSEAAQTIADLRELYGLNVVAVQKGDKELWIGEMRADAKAGRLQVLRDSALHAELAALVPDPGALLLRKIEPRPGSEDHAYDALRYLYRGVHTNHVRKPEPPMTHDQRAEHEAKQHRERALSRNEPKQTVRPLGQLQGRKLGR